MSLSWGFPTFYNCILFKKVLPGSSPNPVNVITPPNQLQTPNCYDESDENIFLDYLNDNYRLNPGYNLIPNCINEGVWPSTFPFNTITTDLDHNSRCNGQVDIGAYELQ